MVVDIIMEQPFWFIVKDMQGNYKEHGQSQRCLGYNDEMYIIETFTDYQLFIDRLATFNIILQ